MRRRSLLLTPLALLAARLCPKGRDLLPRVETLTQKNPLLQDIPWRESDCRVGHRVSVRYCGIPIYYTEDLKTTEAWVR